MKKLLLIGVMLLLALSSCKNNQNKFVNPEDERITQEDWFMITHADSSDLLPCIVMDDYILVIKDTDNSTEILKMEDMSAAANTFAIIAIVCLSIIMIIVIIAVNKN